MTSVLVVDDSEVERRVTGHCVQKGIDVTVLYASDGVDALQKVEQYAPDLVITDLQMPDMDGLELLTRLKEEYPQLPVILVTAMGSELIAAEALQKGAASYVPKRSLASDLPATVKQILMAAKSDLGHSMLMHCLDHDRCQFTLFNDLGLIRTLVNHFQEMLRCLPLGDEMERLRVGIALHEALKNAYYRGNLEIDNSLSVSERESLINSRRMESPYCDRKITVEIEVDRDSVKCVVRDEGPGFDTSSAPDSLSPESMAVGGRGIILMNTIMDEVRFNDSGNEVTLIRRTVESQELGDE